MEKFGFDKFGFDNLERKPGIEVDYSLRSSAGILRAIQTEYEKYAKNL